MATLSPSEELGAADPEGRFLSPPPRPRTTSLPPPRAPKGRRGYGEVLAGDEVRIRNMAGEVVATVDTSGGDSRTSSLLRIAHMATCSAAGEEEQSDAVPVRKVLVDGSGRQITVNDHVWIGEISLVAAQVGDHNDD